MIERLQYFYRATCDGCGRHICCEYSVSKLMKTLAELTVRLDGDRVVCPGCIRKQRKKEKKQNDV